MPEAIRGRGDKVFLVHMTGKEVYDLVHLLEEVAVEDRNYFHVRSAVYAAERIQGDANEQGYNRA